MLYPRQGLVGHQEWRLGGESYLIIRMSLHLGKRAAEDAEGYARVCSRAIAAWVCALSTVQRSSFSPPLTTTRKFAC